MALLNEADAIYLGGVAADRVYLGATLVWPSITSNLAILLQRNYVYADAIANTTVGELTTDGATPPCVYTLLEG